MVLCAAFATYQYVAAGLLVGYEGACKFALFGLILYMGFASDIDSPKGVVCLGAFGFMKGIVLAPLCQAALDIDPSLLITAFLATTAVFTAFSLGAMFSKRRSYLYIGGILGTTLFYMLLGNLASWFLPALGPLMLEANIYLGLAVFCGYVVYDTQVIIEKAEQGRFNFVAHALELFIDFAAIFVRILIILMR